MEKHNNKSEVLGENIHLLRKRLDATQRQVGVSVDMLTEHLIDQHFDLGVDGIYSRFGELCPHSDPQSRARACRVMCEDPRLKDLISLKNLYLNGDMVGEGARGKIAYVRNKRSDDAFLSFANRQKGARAMYVGSFLEACESVFDSVCEFCILPIENGKEGKLYSFYSMIDRYELKICDVTLCETDDGSDSITFALVSRTLEAGNGSHFTKRFEFSLIDEHTELLGDILLATKELGGRVVSVGTQPVPYDELKNLYYFSIDFDGSGADALALYINEEYSKYTPLGHYVIKKSDS